MTTSVWTSCTRDVSGHTSAPSDWRNRDRPILPTKRFSRETSTPIRHILGHVTEQERPPVPLAVAHPPPYRHPTPHRYPLRVLLPSALHPHRTPSPERDGKFSIGWSIATRSNARCNIKSITYCNIRTRLLQHQNKKRTTSKQGYCNIRNKATTI